MWQIKCRIDFIKRKARRKNKGVNILDLGNKDYLTIIRKKFFLGFDEKRSWFLGIIKKF